VQTSYFLFLPFLCNIYIYMYMYIYSHNSIYSISSKLLECYITICEYNFCFLFYHVHFSIFFFENNTKNDQKEFLLISLSAQCQIILKYVYGAMIKSNNKVNVFAHHLLRFFSYFLLIIDLFSFFVFYLHFLYLSLCQTPSTIFIFAKLSYITLKF